jgi:hypothetical protein
MTTLKLSEKLATYLNNIQKETGREVKFKNADGVGMPGMVAVFREHPYCIDVLIAADSQLTEAELEHSIAHEATHGLLVYGRGYYTPFLKHALSTTEKRSLDLLFTMIDDIVVNRIIDEAGFSPYSGIYLATVVEETEAVRKGEDYSNQFSDVPLLFSRFMVFRYIIAWGFLKYFNLEPQARRILKTFLNVFKKTYPSHYEMATKIKKIVVNNSIFTPEGHRKTVEGVLKLWGLQDLVELKRV